MLSVQEDESLVPETLPKMPRQEVYFQKKKLQLTATNTIESMQLSRQVVEKLLDEETPNQIDLKTESLKSYNGMQRCKSKGG